jgi:hypothetical protein
VRAEAAGAEEEPAQVSVRGVAVRVGYREAVAPAPEDLALVEGQVPQANLAVCGEVAAVVQAREAVQEPVVIGAAVQAAVRVQVEVEAVERGPVGAEPESVVEQGPAGAERGPVVERGPVAAQAREVGVVQALVVEVALGEEPQAAEDSVSLEEAGELARGAESG